MLREKASHCYTLGRALVPACLAGVTPASMPALQGKALYRKTGEAPLCLKPTSCRLVDIGRKLALQLLQGGSLSSNLRQSLGAALCGDGQACVLKVAHALLVLCAAAHGQPRPAGGRSCGDAVTLLDAAGQHRHLQPPVQSACGVMTTMQETLNMLALIVTDAHSLALLSLGESVHATCNRSN